MRRWLLALAATGLAVLLLVPATADLPLTSGGRALLVGGPALVVAVGSGVRSFGATALGVSATIVLVAAPLLIRPVAATEAAAWAVGIGLLVEVALRVTQPAPPRGQEPASRVRSATPVVVAVLAPLVVAPLVGVLATGAVPAVWALLGLAALGAALTAVVLALGRRVTA